MTTVSVRCAFFHAGLAKGFDAVADGFHAGERRATAGKRFEQQPEVTACVAAGGAGSGVTGAGCPPLSENAKEAAGDGDEQRADEEIRRKHEREAGFAESTEIEDGDDDEDADAQRDRVRMQPRNGGDQRADARRKSPPRR